MKLLNIHVGLKLILFIIFITIFSSSVLSITYITNCTELQAMQNNLTETYVLSNDIDCSDTINWNGGMGFIPITQSLNFSLVFSGSLEGNGYTIRNLYINKTRTNSITESGQGATMYTRLKK